MALGDNTKEKLPQPYFDEEQIIERYIILLLGVLDEPLPSKIHLQKELFIVTMQNKKLENIFNFEKHHYGQYDANIDYALQSPIYYSNAYKQEKNQIMLSPKGKEYFSYIVNEYKHDENFIFLLSSLKMIRSIYDNLTIEELLLLMYITYPEYIEKADKWGAIQKNKERISKNLLRKKIISESKFREIMRFKI